MLMDDTMEVIEARVRELIVYLDDDVNCELALPFPVAYAIQKMRAALRFAPPRALSPMRRCRLYRRCATSHALDGDDSANRPYSAT